MEVPDFSSQGSKSPVPSDSFDMNSFPQSVDGIAANPNPIPISIPPTSYSPPQPMSQLPSKTIVKAKSNEFLDKRSRGTHCSSSTVEHNISEKKRIERMNQCINELFVLLEVALRHPHHM